MVISRCFPVRVFSLRLSVIMSPFPFLVYGGAPNVKYGGADIQIYKSMGENRFPFSEKLTPGKTNYNYLVARQKLNLWVKQLPWVKSPWNRRAKESIKNSWD